MHCPDCRVPMMVVEYEGVELDFCVACEGTWFDRGELFLLLSGIDSGEHGVSPEQLAALPDAPTAEKKRKCPLCRRRMRKLHIGPENSILIDACGEGHGLWFDRDEVQDLVQQVIDSTPGEAGEVIRFMGRVFHRRAARSGDGPASREGNAE